MRLFFSMLLGISSAVGHGQSLLPQPPEGLKYHLNYLVEETTYHKVAAGTPTGNISPLDLDKMRQHKVVKQVEMKVGVENWHTTSITILNPAEAYAEFPTAIGRFEITDQGTKMYRPDGTLYHEMLADSASQAEYGFTKAAIAASDPKIMYTFPTAPDAALLASIQSVDGTVQNLAAGAWKITLGDAQTLFEPALLRVTTTVFEGGQKKETRIQRYAAGAAMMKPLEEIIKRPVVRPSGLCMEQVVRKRYKQYDLAVAAKGKDRQEQDARVTTALWPSPADDRLTLSLGKELSPDSGLQIFDLAGSIVLEKSGLQPNSQLEIALSGWPGGTYFLRLQTETGSKTLKFVKNQE